MKHFIFSTVAVVALTAAATSMANAQESGVSPVHINPASSHIDAQLPAGIFCHKQLDDDNGVGIVSQNFESEFDAYDARGADDFTLKKACRVSQVRVNGAYYNGSGKADSINVVFFKSSISGTVGRVLLKRAKQEYTDPSRTGNFTVVFKDPADLGPGTFWVSVQVNMDFVSGGEWGWNTNNTARGAVSRWQNPGGAWANGCQKWGETRTCFPSGEGPDFSFALLK